MTLEKAAEFGNAKRSISRGSEFAVRTRKMFDSTARELERGGLKLIDFAATAHRPDVKPGDISNPREDFEELWAKISAMGSVAMESEHRDTEEKMLKREIAVGDMPVRVEISTWERELKSGSTLHIVGVNWFTDESKLGVKEREAEEDVSDFSMSLFVNDKKFLGDLVTVQQSVEAAETMQPVPVVQDSTH
jgi:hypothetical protein